MQATLERPVVGSTAARVVDELVRVVDREWGRAGYAHPRLPEIGCAALTQVAPYERLSGIDALASVASGAFAELHTGTHVARSVIPVYAGPRFTIALHAWAGDLGAPHSHGWWGAYQVIAGTAIDASYRFTDETRHDARFGFGTLARTRLDLMPPGTTVPVVRGHQAMIHGLTYVERLGVSIVIRSAGNVPNWITATFYPSGVRVDQMSTDRVVVQQLTALDALLRLDPDRAAAAFARVLRRSDPRSCFVLLRAAWESFRDRLDFAHLLDVATPGFGDRAGAVRDALGFVEMERQLRRARAAVTDDAHRLVLAALYLAERRADVERVIAGCRGSAASGAPSPIAGGPRPGAIVARAVTEMLDLAPPDGETTLLGTPAGSAFGPVVALLLEDPRTDVVLRRLAEEYDPDEIRAMEPVLRKACASLRTLPLLRPLFAELER